MKWINETDCSYEIIKSNKNFTWSVGRSPKSSGGFVMTYRLLDASNELEVSRNLK